VSLCDSVVHGRDDRSFVCHDENAVRDGWISESADEVWIGIIYLFLAWMGFLFLRASFRFDITSC
jgi:hypothetical protein